MNGSSVSSRMLRFAAACALLGTAAHAQSFNFGFDSIADGANADLGAPAGVTFRLGTFSPDLDSDGDTISGSDRWQVDTGDVVVRPPSFYDRGAAPSSPNALDSINGTTLMLFSSSQTLGSFSVTLDGDTFGENPVYLEFYSVGTSANTLLGSITLDQTTPFFVGTLGTTLANVDMIVLPSGALYDNFSYTVVPEPSDYAIATAAMLGAYGYFRRRSARA
jgi:hypothetical protein